LPVDCHRDGVGGVRELWFCAFVRGVVIAAVEQGVGDSGRARGCGSQNIAGARFIDRVQSAIVIVLLGVSAIFIVVTLGQVDPQLLAPSTSARS
jgi:hypothetical protein